MRDSSQSDRIVDLIRAAADKAGCPRRWALAFAWCESRLTITMQGDLDWHTRQGGALYRRHVLMSERLAHNPARDDAGAWHSYGLFQLMACYHVEPNEHPTKLIDPLINAERGCKAIARLYQRTKGDPVSARLAYVGCGYRGERCDAKRCDQVVRNLMKALERFATEPDAPLTDGASHA